MEPTTENDELGMSSLLTQARAGHAPAKRALAERLAAPLERLAANLAPQSVRQSSSPHDLMVEALRRGLDSIDSCQTVSDAGAVLALRETLLEVIQMRAAQAHADRGNELSDDDRKSQLELGPHRDAWRRYVHLLPQLDETKRAALILFVEGGLELDAIAPILGAASGEEMREPVAAAIAQLSGEDVR